MPPPPYASTRRHRGATASPHGQGHGHHLDRGWQAEGYLRGDDAELNEGAVPDTPRRVNTRAIRRRNAAILAASRICWLCGHDGADAVDHKLPVALRPDLADDPTNLAPAHHFAPCPTCGHKCNREKSDKLIAPVMRRTPGIARPLR